MHAMPGRLAPVRSDAAGPNEMTVLMSAEHGDAFWQQKVSVDPADPMKVTGAGLGTADRPPDFAIPRVARAG